MKLKNQLLPLAIAGLFAFGFTSCSDDDDSSDGGTTAVTIGDFVEGAADYSSLSAALDATGLKETLKSSNQYTVFAPDNDAFDTFLTAAGFTLDNATDEQLAVVKNVLLNHVIGSEVKASTVTSTAPGYISNLAPGPLTTQDEDTNLSTFYSLVSDNVMINGEVMVTNPDAYDATNGIIHAVDAVIGLPKISTFVVADASLSTLEAALIANSLVDTVDNFDPATVFAPNDAAFTAGSYELSDATSDILTYHVISGANVEYGDVEDLGTATPATVQSQTIGILAGPTFKGNGNADDDIADVVTTDIQASNGIIHIIDTVLLFGPVAAAATK